MSACRCCLYAQCAAPTCCASITSTARCHLEAGSTALSREYTKLCLGTPCRKKRSNLHMHSSLMMTQSPGICLLAIVLKTVWIQRVWPWPLQTQLFLRTIKASRCCRRWAGRAPAWAETRMVSQGQVYEHALLFFTIQSYVPYCIGME